MLYKKKTAPSLSDELFQSPTAEFRGAPFWAWNTKLDKDELMRQIDIFKEMGIGGFHMHSRSGMATEYLSDRFMDLVSACNEKAKKEDMLCWLYDEDRWPSGAAGGLVTSDYRYRGRQLILEHAGEQDKRGLEKDYAAFSARIEKGEKPQGYVLASYEIVLDEDGFLKSYRMLAPGETGKNIWRAGVLLNGDNPWYNGQAYLDTMNTAAVRKFVEVTYERYASRVGKDFGGSIPAIFTDEPQLPMRRFRHFSKDEQYVLLPYTDDFEETYRAAYGASFLLTLPELVWNTKNDGCLLTRYRYSDHVSERFVSAFVDTIGQWCMEHNIAFTGHMMQEPTLESQTCSLGEAMRCYRNFQIPGIDLLSDNIEYTTAKQAQSAVHQYGREGMLSELYGVTGWDYPFRGHKRQGDWQAALGVTVRVHHLTWVSMNGDAKRDYPASIGYQSAWWRQYRLVEDHFARLNTALTRGVPQVRVAVVHPVESFWMFCGPDDKTGAKRKYLDTQFSAVTDTLLYGGIDFDYLCESQLPTLCKTASNPLQVGEMKYDCVVIPVVETLRSTTLEKLNAFAKAGGHVIMLGQPPRYVDAAPSDAAVKAAARWTVLDVDYVALLEELEKERFVDFVNQETGLRTGNILHQLRQDGENRWLFFCHGENEENRRGVKAAGIREAVTVTLNGIFAVKEYDTLTGRIYTPAYEHKNGKTVLRFLLFAQDSVLLHLTPCSEQDGFTEGDEPQRPLPLNIGDVLMQIPSLKAAHSSTAEEATLLKDPISYTLHEPNALLMDKAEFAFDGGEWEAETDSILIADIGRKRFYEKYQGQGTVQPWVPIPEELRGLPDHTVSRRFRVHCELPVYGAHLALENADEATILLNGKPLEKKPDGWYVDKCYSTLPLPVLEKGENVLEITMPFRLRTCTEWCYLTGDFGVRVNGRFTLLTERAEKLAFGDISAQTLPFFTGALTYHCTYEETQGLRRTLQLPEFAGVLATARVDGGEEKPIFLAPFTADLGVLEKGSHRIDITLYASRFNGFGQIHNTLDKIPYPGPRAWRTHGTPLWSDLYCLKKVGLMNIPLVY